MAFAFNILSASLKSRLLRFALSRIDFLDDDALDLDQLDLTWGKKNVLALRDVGFNAAVGRRQHVFPTLRPSADTSPVFRNSPLFWHCLPVSS